MKTALWTLTEYKHILLDNDDGDFSKDFSLFDKYCLVGDKLDHLQPKVILVDIAVG